MNSITYLDSVLSRSFNTDNSGSNSNSSSNNATPNPSPRRPTKASSSNNLKSRSSSHLPDLRGFEDGYGRESLEPASSVSATSSPNPKSKDKTNARLRRTGSTPAGVYSSHPNGSEENLSRPARWSGLWSLAGWLDPTATPPSDPTSSQPATQPAVNRARRMPSLDDLLIGGSSLANKPIIKAQQRRSASSGNRPAGRESEPERGGRLATGRRPAYRDLADLVIAGRNRNSSALADDDDDEDEDDGGHDDEPSSESSSLEEDPESMIRYDDQGVQVGSETQAEAAEEEQVEEEEKAAALRSSEREEDEEVDQSLLPSLGSSTPLSNRVLADPVADVRGDPSDSWPVSTPSDPPPSSFPQEGIDGEPSSKDTAGGEESWGGVEAQTVLRHGSAQGNDEGLPPSLEYDEGGREEETHDTAGGQSEAPQRTGSVTRRVRRSRPGTVESSSSAESSISSSSSSSPSSSTSGSPRYRTATSSVSNLAPNETSTAMPLEERSLSDAAGWMGGVEDTGSIVDAQTLIRRRFTVWMGLRKALLALLDAILAVLLFPIHLARSRWIRRDGYGRVRNEQGRSGGAGWSEGKIQDHARDRDEKGGEGEGHEGMEASHDGSKPRRRASSIRFASQSPGGVRQRSVEKRRPRTPRPDDVPTPDPSLLGSTPVGSSGDGSDEAGRGRFDSAFGKEISRRRGDWEPFSSSSSSSASCSSGSSSTSDEEPVTEEQAIAREERRRRRRMRRRRAGGESRLDSGSNEEGKDENTDLGEENEKVKGEGEEDLGWNPKVMSRKPSKSKLLPNPHPIDPMLVGNKDAKPIDEEKAMLEAMQASERSLRVSERRKLKARALAEAEATAAMKGEDEEAGSGEGKVSTGRKGAGSLVRGGGRNGGGGTTTTTTTRNRNITIGPTVTKLAGMKRNPNLNGANGGGSKANNKNNPSSSSSVIHHSPKILVLDLDETLIHSTSRSPSWNRKVTHPNGGGGGGGGGILGLEVLGGFLGLGSGFGGEGGGSGASASASTSGGNGTRIKPHMVEVVLDGRSVIYHVYKRPYVDYFLRKVASWYQVVIFTASVQEYADPVIDWLDQGRGLISGRLFREACTYKNGSYLKNLEVVDSDLGKVCLIDNSPASYSFNQANGIPIEGWTHDPNDEALLDLLPMLDSLRFASDVRHVLGIRGF